MVIDINLAAQQSGLSRKWMLVSGIAGAFVVLFYIWMLTNSDSLSRSLGPLLVLAWMAPITLDQILHGLGKPPLIARLKGRRAPYLKINEHRLEQSRGGWFSKPESINWDDVKKIDLKLFEIHLTKSNSETVIIDLNALTDDNLKLVKDFVAQIKSSRSL
ncbi:MAG: hypothetical protein ACK5DD_16390 [Cyclobacteriaceae bacterium]|jgi:hypothetical protein